MGWIGYGVRGTVRRVHGTGGHGTGYGRPGYMVRVGYGCPGYMVRAGMVRGTGA